MPESKPDGLDSSESKPVEEAKNPFLITKEKKRRKLWLAILAVAVVIVVVIAAVITYQYIQSGTRITEYSAELTLDWRTANVTYQVTLVNGRSADQTVELHCISSIGNSSFLYKLSKYAVVTVPAGQTITVNLTFDTAEPDNFFIGNPDPPRLINYTCEMAQPFTLR
jgi:heme/copper-type cytochrome/quinol oxidase subunit 2